MRFFRDVEFFRGSFNDSAAHVRTAHLTEQMTQAFYRREHDTIEYLAKQGAQFTPEMLSVAVGMRDHHLTGKCLGAGITPDEDMVRSAVGQKDAPLTAMLIQRITPTKDLKTYIETYATEAVKKAAAPALARVAPEP